MTSGSNGKVELGASGSALNTLYLANNLFASGASNKFANGFANIVIGNITGGNLSVTGTAAFMDSVSLLSGGDITINAGASVSMSEASGNLILSATRNFLNLAGSSALSTTDSGSADRWIIYTANPTNANFGPTGGILVSGNKAFWGSTYGTLAPTSTDLTAATGNRYVFSTGGDVTVTTTNATMTYGVPIDLSSNYTVSNTSLNASPTGTPFLSNVVADIFATVPTISSTGNTALASVGQYDITATDGVGSTGFTLTYTPNTDPNAGKLTVDPARVALGVVGDKVYDGSKDFNVGSLTISGLANGDALATATANSANVADNGGNYFVSFTMSSGLSSNYVLVSGYNATTNAATITARPITLTASAQSKNYGDALSLGTTGFARTSGTYATGESADAVVLTSANNYAANISQPVASYANEIGISGATGSNGFLASNYNITYVAGALTVNQKDLIITANDDSKTYGTVKTYGAGSTAFASNGLVGSETIGSVTITDTNSGGVTTADAGGVYALTPSAATGGTFDSSNYRITYTAGSLQVDKADAYVIIAANQSSIYGATPVINYSYYSVASGTGGSVIDPSAGLSGTATFINEPTDISNVNTYALTYSSGLSSTNYSFNPATSAVTYTVNKATIVVNSSNSTLIYNGVAQSNTGTATTNGSSSVFSSSIGGSFMAPPGSSGPTQASSSSNIYLHTGIGTDVFAISGAATRTNVGTTADNFVLTPVAQVGTDAANYHIVYNNAQLTINPAPLGVTVNATYSGSTTITPSSYQFSGLVNNETITSLASATISDANVSANGSNYVIGLIGGGGSADLSNYVINAGYNAGSSGVITNGVFSGTTSGTGANTGGTNAVTLSKANAYVLINSGQSSVYGSTPILNYTLYNNAVGSSGAAITAITSGTAVFVNEPTATSNAATYSLTYSSGLSSTNYAFNAASSPVNYVVNKATLTVTADNKSRVYGDVNPALEYTITGYVNGENLGSSGVTGDPTISTAATAGSNVNAYAISAAANNLSASNYQFSFVDGTLTVNRRPVTVIADSKTKIYGNVNPSLTYTVAADGMGTSRALYSTDTLLGSLATTATNSTGVGTVAITQGTVDNTNNNNYDITYTSANLTIGKATLNVTADNKSKVYGDVNPELEYTISGYVNGEDLGSSGVTGAPTISTIATAASNVNTYAITSAANNLAASNYDFSYVDGTLTVNRRPVTVTGNNKTKTYGDVNPILDYAVAADGVGTSRGMYNSQTLRGDLATTADQATGAGTVAITQGTLTNGANSNYDITYNNGTLTIDKALLLVSANPDAKFVTQTDATNFNGANYSGFVNGDTASNLTGTLRVTRTNVTQNNAGVYSGVLQPSGLTSANYDISYATGQYTITPAETLLIDVNNLNVTYGASPSFVISSVKYMDGTNFIHTLSRDSVINNTYTYSDGVGGSATFTLATGAAQTSSGHLVIGNYAVTGVNFSKISNNFNNNPVYIGNLSISKAPIGIQVVATYGGTTTITPSSFTITGLASGETLNPSMFVVNDKNVSANGGNFVTAITPGAGDTADLSNYTLIGTYNGTTGSPAINTVTINKANLTVSATPSLTGNVYNGSAYTGTYTTNAVNDETFTVTGLATGTNAGTYASNLVVSGSALDNYNNPTVNNANLVISKKSVTIRNLSSATTYDGASSYSDLMSSAGFTHGTLVGSDSIASVTQTASVSGVTVSGIAQSGTFIATPSVAVMGVGLADNYAFTYESSINTVTTSNPTFSYLVDANGVSAALILSEINRFEFAANDVLIDQRKVGNGGSGIGVNCVNYDEKGNCKFDD